MSGLAIRSRLLTFAGLALATLLACAICCFPRGAWASEIDDVRAQLSEKTAELELLVEGITAEKKRVAALDKEIDEILSSLSEKQEAHGRLRDDASALARVMYKDNEDFNVLMLLEQSGSFEDFFYRLEMRDHVLAASADMLDELQKAQDELDEAYAQASKDKDEQEALLADMKKKQADLNALVKELKKREKELDKEEQAALAQAAAAAHALAETFATDASVDEVDEDAESRDDANAGKGPDPEKSSWHTGLASAYGGASDKMTPNPGTTATGTVCDDWSVGVAIPMKWGPQRYYGKYVEVSYEGQSIVAPVVDCGEMAGGSRALDLQPGVFKAFGCNRCNDWGVREVRYRFL